MFIITLLFPNACMVGFEYIEESEEFYFNELNLYFFVFAIAYRWRGDGGDIENLEL